VAAMLVAACYSARALCLDILKTRDACEQITAAGPFDILLNNAGTNRPKPITEATEADYDAVLGLNLRSAFFVAQAVAPGMIAAGQGGALIHIGSQIGHVGGANRSLYCASK
jgi:NAD(P)-dependent dehydrogenase (short-subunit alcohol dehydrogenase family)